MKLGAYPNFYSGWKIKQWPALVHMQVLPVHYTRDEQLWSFHGTEQNTRKTHNSSVMSNCNVRKHTAVLFSTFHYTKAKMVATFLKGTELIRRPYLQLAWIYMLVVIFKSNEKFFLEGLVMANFSFIICARMRIASVPRLKYRLLPSFCSYNYLQIIWRERM